MESEPSFAFGHEASSWSFKKIGLFFGPIAMLGWLVFGGHPSLTAEGHRLAGILILTIIWWITEPIPIPITGILSVSMAVVLGAVPPDPNGKSDAATLVLAPFAHPSVFFLLGGVFIGRSMTRHGLDRRLALSVLCTRWAGRSPTTVLGAIGIAVTLISMWISNTAATAMMYPVTLGIISVLSAGNARRRLPTGGEMETSESALDVREIGTTGNIKASGFEYSPYATALLLMTAYASSIGGISTPIGTATNVVAIGFFKTDDYFGRNVDFARWTVVGLPITVTVLVGLFFGLRLVARQTNLDMDRLRDYLRSERESLGEWKRGEWNTSAVFLIAISLWITPGILAILNLQEARASFSRHLPEEIIALMCPVLLYLLPVDWRRGEGTLRLSDLSKVDWGTVLLFGAGLSLGGLMFRTGLAREIGQGLFNTLGIRDVWGITALSIFGGIVLSEFTSNAGSATALIPVVLAICKQANMDPIFPLLGVTLGSSFGSALPVSTPPNAIVYSSGWIPVRRMVASGIGVDILAAVSIWAVLRLAGFFQWSPFN